MPISASIRLQVETALAHRIPSALTPAPKFIRPVVETGIEPLDELLHGGLPVGALSEVVGPECSGRTDIALSFVARLTQASKVCAWIDASDALDPVSASAAGVDLARLLWVRCGVTGETTSRVARGFVLPEKYLAPRPPKKGLHGGGFGSHPRNEVKGMPNAIGSLLQPASFAPRCAEPQRRVREEKDSFVQGPRESASRTSRHLSVLSPWSRIEQALKATDLIVQGGGFSAVVLDLGSLASEFVSRIQLSTWFRYRAAAERTQSSFLLLGQHPCAKSAAELLLQLQPAKVINGETTVFSGIEAHAEITRRRFIENTSNVVSMRKPSRSAQWHSRTAWVGAR
jgi:recombination protein RecA